MKRALRWSLIAALLAALLCAPALAETPEDGLYTVGVSSSSDMFRVVQCALQVEDGNMAAVLTLGGTGYGYLYPGTADEAALADRDTWIPSEEDWDGKFTFAVPVERLDEDVAVAAYSIKYEKWYDRTLHFFSNTVKAYAEIAPEGVYEGRFASDTALDGARCLVTSDGTSMEATLFADARALRVDDQAAIMGADGWTFALGSLDTRIPVEAATDAGRFEGYLTLNSRTLAEHVVTVEDGTYAVDAVTDSNLLRFTQCELTARNGGMTARLTAGNNNFDYLYVGSAKAARIDTAAWIPAIPDESGAYTYLLDIPTLDNAMKIATYSAKKKMWYDRTLTLESASMTRLTGDVYVPDEFTCAGGTGRVTITCPQVAVIDGQATATIVFSSKNYSTVKVGGAEYAAVQDGERSAFAIPVALNQSVEILATTTAMSQTRDIAYSLFIRVDALAGEAEHPQIADLSWESEMELLYADMFSVDYYEGGYALIDVKDDAKYLVVPENAPIPEGLDPSVVVLERPIDNAYLAATSAMALFDALDALSAIRMVGTDITGWYIDGAVDALKGGEMLFGGRYSEPDFEMLLREKCDLAIESTMILHSPKVKEMMELLGIPVFIDRSNYERHPLGRTEWIKLYGVIADKGEEALAFFDKQARIIEKLKDFPNTEKTVAFCYIHSDGSAVVRASWDYVPRMIEIAGGRYVFENTTDPQSDRSSVSLTMEEFYNAAVNADYLIYNAAIDSPVYTIDELLGKSPLFADFKAVKDANVWCTGKYLYQATDIAGHLITDIHNMLTGAREGMTFLYKLD